MTHPNCHIQLDDLLSVLGINHRPSKIEGKRDWLNADGACIGTFDATQGWAIIKSAPAMFSAIDWIRTYDPQIVAQAEEKFGKL